MRGVCATVALILSLLSVANALLSSRLAPKQRLRSLHILSAATKTYCVNVNLYVKPECREEFLKVIRVNAQGTRTAEPLNLSYTWGESTTQKGTFHFQEQFKGEEGFTAHTQAPHFKVWANFADRTGDASPFWKPPEVIFFEAME
jgi:hypothetical protein